MRRAEAAAVRAIASDRSTTPPSVSATESPLTVSVGAKKLGDVADGRILRLDLPTLGAQSGALGFEVRKGLTLTLALCHQHLTGFA